MTFIMWNIHFNESIFVYTIKKLKLKKSSSVDNFPSYIYKSCVELLEKPFAFLYNFSIRKNKFPSKLNQAIITSILKNGCQYIIDDYRRISLLSSH